MRFFSAWKAYVVGVSKPHVSATSKSADCASTDASQVWKPAIQRTWKSALLCSWFCVVAISAIAELSDLKVFPQEVNLTTKNDRQSIVVQAVYSDGVTRD